MSVVRNITLEAILHVTLLMSFNWYSVLAVNVGILGLPLILNDSIFISQILKQRKKNMRILATLILLATIQLILMVT